MMRSSCRTKILRSARAAFERALAIQRAAFGDDHPVVAIALANLAGPARRAFDTAAARALLVRANSFFQRRLGPMHAASMVTSNALRALERAPDDD
jgi:hypothetical protein